MYKRIDDRERSPANTPPMINIIPASLGFLLFQMLTIPTIVRINARICTIIKSRHKAAKQINNSKDQVDIRRSESLDLPSNPFQFPLGNLDQI